MPTVKILLRTLPETGTFYGHLDCQGSSILFTNLYIHYTFGPSMFNECVVEIIVC